MRWRQGLLIKNERSLPFRRRRHMMGRRDRTIRCTGAAGRAGSEISVVCRGPVNGGVLPLGSDFRQSFLGRFTLPASSRSRPNNLSYLGTRSAKSDQRSHQEFHRHGPIGLLKFCNSRLTGPQKLCKLLLCDLSLDSHLSDLAGERQLDVNKNLFIFTELQKIGRRSSFPASCFELLLL